MYCNGIPVEWSTEEMPISVAFNVRRLNQTLKMSDDINVLVSIGKQGGNKLNLTYGQFK